MSGFFVLLLLRAPRISVPTICVLCEPLRPREKPMELRN